VGFSRLSTGTKLSSKTQKKFKKVSVLDLVPVLRVQKQLKKIFQKTFYLDYKYLELWNAPLFLMNILKIKNPKERWNTRPFWKR
jgi:hypothetical protein